MKINIYKILYNREKIEKSPHRGRQREKRNIFEHNTSAKASLARKFVGFMGQATGKPRPETQRPETQHQRPETHWPKELKMMSQADEPPKR